MCEIVKHEVLCIKRGESVCEIVKQEVLCIKREEWVCEIVKLCKDSESYKQQD